MENLKINTKLFINGEWVDSKKNQKIKVINPATEEVLCEVHEATEEDMELAIQSARKALTEWSSVALCERTKLFMKLADKVEQEIDHFSLLESLDNGKPYIDSVEDMKEVIRCIRYYGGLIEGVFGHTYTTTDEYTIHSRRVPYGVVGCIAPWNYPLLMCIWKILPALAAGNTVVMKPSEETPLTILKFAQVFSEVEFPKGTLNVVVGYGAVAGDYLSKSKHVNKISFTGSTNVGRMIMKASADTNLKSVHLELGGKSPIVVFSDADIENAVEWVVDGAFRNTAQNCCCSSRIFVEDGIYDDFVKRLVERTKKIKVGKYNEEGVFIGPLINARQLKNALNYIKIGKEDEKLEIVTGGNRIGDKGYFVEPTIFINVHDESRLAREEIFGPVLCVMKSFKSPNEALERANDTNYGLASGVFTKDMDKAEYFVRNIQAGTVWVNYYNITPYNVPFGGMKQSGFGRDNGIEAILEHTTTKSVYQRFNIKF
jgi:acyl-CoA reductase-like NAD-dependent aldehyde dehydrogenase